ncbi:MAG TPA: 23S rRNA (adenine(2503)-C(2))-methyltransferase RlmN [Myxococcales bacterium]|nr:23S rRNA (adenine(2503)-C(2))-methyltransferase RlmN [Myxococcales bacterium]
MTARDLRALARPEVEALAVELGEKPFRGRQLHRWLHRRGAGSIEEMTDLPAAFRQALAAVPLRTLAVDATQESSDETVKYRLRTDDGKLLESVFMPEPSRRTLCVSTQVGCAMGCTFCRTATMGLVRNLGAGEIVDQVYRVNRDLVARGLPKTSEAGRVLSNLVFMGMGEPLHNLDEVVRALDLLMDPDGLGFSHRHITVSTSGLVPEIAEFGRRTEVKLAISLNAPNDAKRERIMPVNRKYPIEDLVAACRAFPQKQGRRLTFEYVLLGGVNDSDADARELAALCRRAGVKVNLIAYNENPGLGFAAPTPARVSAFQAILAAEGIVATLRKNRGRDIAGACGQLAVEGMRKPVALRAPSRSATV